MLYHLSSSGRVAKPEHSCNIIKKGAEYKTEEKRGGPHVHSRTVEVTQANYTSLEREFIVD